MKKPDRLGRYEVVGLLGHGGMGAVYKARDPVLDRFVAVKLISPIFPVAGSADEALERFRREARAAGRLSHPNIVAVHDMGIDEATQAPFIVMECVDGIPLSTVLSENPTMPLVQALEIVGEVGAALTEAHAHGIVHRDIKPGNVFLDARGRVKVGDFGIARVDGSELTQAGVALGTPGYLAPELLHGGAADVRSDVFALGVLAYQLLAGKKPFDGPTPAAITLDVVQRVPDPPRTLRPEIPPHVSAAVMRALDKSPATRTATVEAFLRELREATTVAPAPTVPLATKRTGGGRLAVAGLAGTVAVCLGAFLFVRGCAPTSNTQVASPARKSTPAALIDDEPAPTRRPTPARTLPPVETTEREVEAPEEPEVEGREQPSRRRAEEAAAGWVLDRIQDALENESGNDDKKEKPRGGGRGKGKKKK